MELIVKKKNVFGIDRIYPKCDKALLLLKLMEKSQVTFTDYNIRVLKQLGYTLTTKKEEI